MAIFCFLSAVLGEEELLSLDVLYMPGLKSFYENAREGTETIWPGMELGPVCLYRVGGPAFLFNHPLPPESFREVEENLFVGSQADWQLLGATQMEINGVLTAIVDYGREHYGSPDEVFAELFHELHHVHQRNHVRNIAFDNPAVLLRYPEDPRNDALKLLEQRLLFQMCFADSESGFREHLNLFYRCREERKAIIGDYLEYEKTVENMEGPAFYSEYQFYNAFGEASSDLKESYLHRHFFGVLTTPYYGRNQLRLRHLASGMALCLILDRYHPEWKSKYYASGMHLYDFFVAKLAPEAVDLPDLSPYEAMSAFHTDKAIEARQRKYKEFNEQSGVEVVLEFAGQPDFRGFDPMRAEAIDAHTILHRTLLRLGKGEDQLFFTDHLVVSYVGDQIWQVQKLRFFVPSAEHLVIDEGSLAISVPGIDLEWSGEIIESKERLFHFRCR